MLYLRFTIDGAVPLKSGSTTSMTLAEVAAYAPDVLKPKLAAIKQAFLDLKASCAKINAGQVNVEDTLRFNWHICTHGVDNAPCDEKDIG